MRLTIRSIRVYAQNDGDRHHAHQRPFARCARASAGERQRRRDCEPGDFPSTRLSPSRNHSGRAWQHRLDRHRPRAMGRHRVVGINSPFHEIFRFQRQESGTERSKHAETRWAASRFDGTVHAMPWVPTARVVRRSSCVPGGAAAALSPSSLSFLSSFGDSRIETRRPHTAADLIDDGHEGSVAEHVT